MKNKKNKVFIAELSLVEEVNEKGEVIWDISTDSIDRDGDIIDPKGVDFTHYLKNPIVLFNHASFCPLGKTIWIKAHNDKIRVKGKLDDYDESGSAFNKSVYSWIKQGIISAASISFIPYEGHYDKVKDAFVYDKVEMLEWSPVSLPSNRDALIQEVKGLDMDQKVLDKIFYPANMKIEEQKGEVEMNEKELMSIVKRIEDRIDGIEKAIEEHKEYILETLTEQNKCIKRYTEIAVHEKDPKTENITMKSVDEFVDGAISIAKGETIKKEKQ